jgi:alpha-ketoglutarate-dependent taurine dioxygenase
MTLEDFTSSVLPSLLHGSAQLIVEDVAFEPQELLGRLEKGVLKVIPSSDGPLSVVRDDNDPVDFNHHGRNFDFHTDGLYYEEVPDFVGLYCVNAGSGATRTIFTDTRRVAAGLGGDDRMKVLLDSQVVWIKKDASEYLKPLVVPHPRTGEKVLHMTARGYIRPISEIRLVPGMPSLRDYVTAQSRLFELLNESICHEHRWIAGQMILFDNYTYVHARENSRPDPDRVLYRFWLSARRPSDVAR